MKRSIITTVVALLLGVAAAAQGSGDPQYQFHGMVFGRDILSTADIFSLSQTQSQFGTARSMSMGGAFTSLGADLASMSINPAGLGMYRRGEVAVTPVVTMARASNDGLSPSQQMPYRSNSKNRFALGNIGAVFNVYEGQGRLLSLNFGIGYNRMADYNYNYSFQYAGSDRTASVADAFSLQLDAGGASVGSNGITLGNRSDWGIEGFFWPAVAAYKTYLVDRNSHGVWYPAEIGDNATIDGGAAMRSTGSAGEFDISMGGNWNNKLYFGFTLGIQSIYQKQRIYYGEMYSYGGGNGYGTGDPAVDADGQRLDNVMQHMGLNQTTEVEGAGVNFKLGVVYRPTESLRLGVAFHTPTFYSLDRHYFLVMSTESIGPTAADKGDYRPHTYTSDAYPEDAIHDTGDFGWEFVSPSRLLFGASYTFGNVAILSVDYQRDWYNGIRVKNHPYPILMDSGDYKQDFKNYFKGSNTVRAGLEVRPLPLLALRAGFGYSGSMLRDETVMFDTPVVYQSTSFSAGVGVALGRSAYLDLAYSYVRNKMTPYQLFYADLYDAATGYEETYQSEIFTTKLTRHAVALTLGFRF